jgi:G3E family GTPase
METTGLADPAPVAFTFFANPWVASRFKLDSIMCAILKMSRNAELKIYHLVNSTD